MLHTAGYADDDYDMETIFITGAEDERNYIKIVCCGHDIYNTDSAHVVRAEGRLDYQVIYIAGGRGAFSFRENKVWLGEGNIVIYRPHVRNEYAYSYQDCTDVYWVHFTGSGTEQLLKNVNLDDENYFYVGTDSEYTDIFENIIRDMQIKKPYYHISVASQFTLLLSLMAKNIHSGVGCNSGSSNGSGKNGIRMVKAGSFGASGSHSYYPNAVTDDLIAGVIEKMHRDFNLNTSIAKYAEECNICISWFIKCFRRHTGTTPNNYINSIRAERAVYLLSNTSMPINEIAAVTGYSNVYYFSRAFKMHTGMPPGMFREKVQKSRK